MVKELNFKQELVCLFGKPVAELNPEEAAEVAAIRQEVAQENMEEVLLEKPPRIAVYSPPNKQPWDDAVTLFHEFGHALDGILADVTYRTSFRSTDFAELPSGGDNSYPGFVELTPTSGVISWYSSHEKDNDGQTITAIYLADLEIAD